jgi:hypothetical protein
MTQIKSADGMVYNVPGGGTQALGIIGTVLGGIAVANQSNGLLGNLFGGNNNTNNCQALMSELAKEKAERYTDQVGTEVYKQFAKERNETQAQINALFAAIAQMDKTISVNEAVTNERVTCLAGKVSNIYDVFKLVVPNSSVCPGWGNVTITPSASTTTGA